MFSNKSKCYIAPKCCYILHMLFQNASDKRFQGQTRPPPLMLGQKDEKKRKKTLGGRSGFFFFFKCLILVTFHQTKKSDMLGVKSSFRNQVVLRVLCRKWSSVAAKQKAHSFIYNPSIPTIADKKAK